MGQTYSSSSSVKSRSSGTSGASSIAADFASIVKFVGSNHFTEDFLLTTPKTSAHRAFKRYIDASRRRAERKMATATASSSTAQSSTADAGGGAGLDTTIEMLNYRDIESIEKVWPKLEPNLLPIGIRVFISILESRSEVTPICKSKDCCEKKPKHGVSKVQCCPNQIVLHEELQKFILLLVGTMRRAVKHIRNQSSVLKLLKKVGEKHFSKINLDLSRVDHDCISAHFAAAVKEMLSEWTPEMEVAYSSLIRVIVTTMQKLALMAERDLDKSSSNGSLHNPPSSATSTSSLNASFDRHLVLFGCQTFQDFFDLHPHLLNHFDQYACMRINERVNAADALKMHASRVLALVEDIVNNSGNPDKIRSLLQDLGRHHYEQGISEEHLDMLGPIVCHTIRPLVFKSGLWSIEVEKSWSHLFDMVAVLMKRGYPEKPPPPLGLRRSYLALEEHPPSQESIFPSLTHIIILKDTWNGILEQMHELGLSAIVKLFKINYNLRFHASSKVRYRPRGAKANEDNLEHLGILFNLIISIVDHLIQAFPNSNSAAEKQALFTSAATLRQLEVLRQPMEWIGPVFCNTVRPLLLVQGKWSFQVEVSWRLLFRHLIKKNRCSKEEESD